ncbi:MAG: hypothetical protein ACK4TA_13235 [Saprospiraceae bacterium]
MENSKLLLLLKTFSATELRAFKDFVESPYFNKNEELIRLNAYLKKQAAKGFPGTKLQRKAVYAAVYPGESYDEKKLNYALSLLLKLAERFVAIQGFENWGIVPDYQVLTTYSERHLPKNYDYIFQQASANVEVLPYRNDDYYFQHYLLADVADAHFSAKNERRFDPALQQAADCFDIYYMAKKLRFLCNMLDRQKFISTKYNLYYIDEIKMMLTKRDWSAVPPIAVYYQLLLLLTEKEPLIYFNNFRQLLKAYIQLFPLAEARELYRFAINFYIQQIRVGEKQFAQDLMALYREGIDNQVLLEKGQLSPWTFKNMVKLGLGLRQYDWVEQFVTEFSAKLDADKRQDAYHFNLADLYYHKKDLTKTLFHLNQVEFSDISYHIGAKSMLLKIYYETPETEAFLSLIATFRVFLQRNKSVPKEVKMPYLNFVNLLHELFRHGKTRWDTLREKIEQTPMLTERSWLKEQLEKLKPQR